ncbi:MAG: family 78 glycoside hydrolase catalytic domain [Bacteroidetes bacterium]|nr:family 78 glycoside hydrolase catalytic domain [Bacteroidota bacterium]
MNRLPATVLLSIVMSTALHALSIKHLRVEGLVDPMGIEYRSPRFGWILESANIGVMQVEYQIEITDDQGNNWSSGWVMSERSQWVGTAFVARPGTAYQWKVSAKDNQGHLATSGLAYFETGLWGQWKAEWITVPWAENPRATNPVQRYKKAFSLPQQVVRARLYITSLGLYKALVNGQPVTNTCLNPGWTSYPNRIQYQAYDVTSLLGVGANALCVELAEGWHRGRINYRGKEAIPYKEKCCLLAQMEITLANGKTLRVTTDKSWICTVSNILEASIYDGEVAFFSANADDWAQPGSAKDWQQVQTVNELGYNNIIGQHAPQVAVMDTLYAKHVTRQGDSVSVFDFGQVITGWVSIAFTNNLPKTVRIEHAEALTADGSFYTANLRSARAEICLSGNCPGYTPQFTYMGFRYVRVSGIPFHQIASIHAQVVHSKLARSSSFVCGDTLVNKLYNNILWSQKGNFLDIPTDCPQRDERMGWTGDAQVFSITAAYNMEVSAFFRKWLADLAADQYPDGSVPWVVPNVFPYQTPPSAGWADAAAIVPWNMYVFYGDRTALMEAYPSMKAWAGYMIGHSTRGLYQGVKHFGDWLSYNPDDDRDGKAAVTEKDFIAQAYYTHTLFILSQAAQELGMDDEKGEFDMAYADAWKAFNLEYVTRSGRLVSGTQTAYTLALAFHLLPDSLRPQAALRLAQNVRRYGHISTGFLGTPLLCQVLTQFGYHADAYQLLLNQQYPSWLYPITLGATTIWERWDGVKEDGSFQNPSMNSFNHYAYGAIGAWLFGSVLGIKPDFEAPGFQYFVLSPVPNGDLGHASGSYYGPYGSIELGWKHQGNGLFEGSCTVPSNASARFEPPLGFELDWIRHENGVQVPIVQLAGKQLAKLPSGKYTFALREMDYGK